MNRKVKGAFRGDKALMRSLTRLHVVQALYQMDLVGVGVNDVVADFETYPLSEEGKDVETGSPDRVFFRDLVCGIVREQRVIDPLVDAHLAAGWRLTRIDSILRAILRAGTYELCWRQDVPLPVVIDEYVELAYAFFDAGKARAVNAVLDAIAREIRSAEVTA